MGNHRTNKLIFALCTSFLLALGGSPHAEEIVDRIVAIVGEEVLTLQDLKNALQAKSNDDLIKIPKNKQEKILDDLIEKSLLEQKAKKLGIAVTDKEIDEEIEAVKKINKLTTEVLVEALKKEGITLDEYKSAMRIQIVKAKLVNREIRPQIVINDDFLREFYTKEIAGEKELIVDFEVITFPDDPKGKIHGAVKDYYDMAKEKRPLEEIHKKAADDFKAEYNRTKNIKLAHLTKDLREAMQNMKIGELGPLVRFASGYQIFRLTGVNYEGLKPFDEVKEDLKKKYLKEKMEKAYNEWLNDLKREIYVEKRL